MKKIRLLALFLALITAGALYYFLSQSAQKPAEIPKSNVIVAAADIPENTVITEQMIKLISAPAETVLPKTFTKASDIIGKTTNAKIMSGEQIIGIRLVEVGSTESGTLAYAIKPGMRAITIGVNDTSSLKNMVKPGDYIDIIAQYQIEKNVVNAKGTNEVKTIPEIKLLLQYVKVLAVDQTLRRTGTAKYTTMTLEVTAEQAMQVSFSENNGLLRAILRSPLDTANKVVKNVTINDIIGS